MASTSIQLLSPLGPNEESFLEEYFKLLSQFAFDKAKDLADKKKEGQKTVFGSSWALFIHSLSQLAVSEKTYSSLGFFEQRGLFTRSKDELRKVEETVRGLESQNFGMPRPTVEFEKLLAHICSHLCNFITSRLETMNFYEQMHVMGLARNVNMQDLLIVISEIIHSHSKHFHHPLLQPLKTAFSYECDTINHLLQAQILMYDRQFLQSMLHLYQAHTKLTSWGGYIQYKEVKKSTFGSKTSGLPALYEWLLRFKLLLLSKFTLYFHDNLQKQAAQNEMKTLCAKIPEDFVTKIMMFQKKTDAFNVSLVLDMGDLQQGLSGSGYTLPGHVTPSPTGLDSYPVIISCPAEKPMTHWPNVVMMISERREASHPLQDKVQYLYDKSVHTTYFLMPVDVRITVVVIYECKKSEKDSYINNFISDMASQLKCHKIFTMLKPGSK